MSLQVDLVSPEEVLLSTEAEMVIARCTDGEIAFLKKHIPFVGILQPDTVRVYEPGGNVIKIEIQSGFLEVNHDHVTVLSDKVSLPAAKQEPS